MEEIHDDDQILATVKSGRIISLGGRAGSQPRQGGEEVIVDGRLYRSHKKSLDFVRFLRKADEPTPATPARGRPRGRHRAITEEMGQERAEEEIQRIEPERE